MRMTCIALALTLAACGAGDKQTTVPDGDPVVEPAPETSDPAAPADPNIGDWKPNEDEKKVYDRLKVKTPEPRCPGDVEVGVTDAVGALRGVITHVTAPPWVSMRAATCLLQAHAKEGEADALKWVADPEQAGLTTLVLGRLDSMPLEIAKRIAQASLEGPHKDLAKTRISRLRTKELKALAAAAPE